MISGINTVRIWLDFIPAKEIKKTLQNVFSCTYLMLNTIFKLLFMKNKIYSGS